MESATCVKVSGSITRPTFASLGGLLMDVNNTQLEIFGAFRQFSVKLLYDVEIPIQPGILPHMKAESTFRAKLVSPLNLVC